MLTEFECTIAIKQEDLNRKSATAERSYCVPGRPTHVEFIDELADRNWVASEALWEVCHDLWIGSLRIVVTGTSYHELFGGGREGEEGFLMQSRAIHTIANFHCLQTCASTSSIIRHQRYVLSTVSDGKEGTRSEVI